MISGRGLTIFLFLVVACIPIAHSSGRGGKQELRCEVIRLYSRDAQVRADAASRLTTLGSSAIPSLTEVVCDRSKSNFDSAWPVAAKALGDMKAKAAVPCLIELLMYNYPSIGPVIMKPDETLADVDPSFAALVRIGEPAVPEVRKRLPFLGPEEAIMALRVLRAINTPGARDAAESYITVLQDQLRFSQQVLEEFGKKR
jgi:hypothetical protein